MKKFFPHLKILVAATVFFALTSCNSKKEDENNAVLQDTASKKVTSKDTNNFFYSLPSPLLMTKVFKKTGVKYMEGIANSCDNVSKYTSNQSMTLNLGVYSTDLAYAVLNKQTQQATKYMESIKKLSDGLGMSPLFNADYFLTRFKNNLGNEDSLILVVAQLKEEMDVFLKDNGKEKQTLMIFVGAWVENMYIATQLTKEDNKEKIVARVAEQKDILHSLMNVTTNFQNDNDFKDTYLKLTELKTLFDNLTVQGEDEKVTMNEAQWKAIKEKTNNFRKDIVG
ncbi:MAG: hypothetical protein ACHQHP_02405 [Bacteroidia bacterium]